LSASVRAAKPAAFERLGPLVRRVLATVAAERNRIGFRTLAHDEEVAEAGRADTLATGFRLFPAMPAARRYTR
jgi:hypothetical protein